MPPARLILLVVLAFSFFPATGSIDAFDITIGGLAGTIYTPSRIPKAAVVLIGGSGPIDRNGNTPSLHNDSLKYLARDIATDVAVLTYDKRGVAGSASLVTREDDVQFSDFVRDATIAARYMCQRFHGLPLYLIGHSEGGLVALSVADELNHLVSGVILIAVPGKSLDQIIIDQLNLNGMPIDVVQQVERLNHAIIVGQPLENVPKELSPLYRLSVVPYLRSILRVDPTELIAKLKVPALVISGSNDIQVDEENAQLLVTANRSVKHISIEGMNHVFKRTSENKQENLMTYRSNEKNHPDLALVVKSFITKNSMHRCLPSE